MMDFGGPQRITRGAMQYDWGGGLWPPSLHVKKGPAGELGVSKSMEYIFLQCFATVGWATGRASGL